MEERRRWPRSLEGSGASVKVMLGDSDGYREIEARLVNCSHGGAQLVTDDGGVRLGMAVVIKSFDGRPVIEDGLEGRIVWVMERDGCAVFGCEYPVPLVNLPPFF